VHVAVDDYSRLGFAQVLAYERATSATAFLRALIAFYREHGIQIHAIMSDNGSPTSRRVRDRLPHTRHPPPAHSPLLAPHQRQIRALYPHHARRMGSRDRLRLKRPAHASPARLAHRYNTTRPHGSLGHHPISRLPRNNLLASYI
jgi:hypothetical protein